MTFRLLIPLLVSLTLAFVVNTTVKEAHEAMLATMCMPALPICVQFDHEAAVERVRNRCAMNRALFTTLVALPGLVCFYRHWPSDR